mgnify:CR=1 FL=1
MLVSKKVDPLKIERSLQNEWAYKISELCKVLREQGIKINVKKQKNAHLLYTILVGVDFDVKKAASNIVKCKQHQKSSVKEANIYS